MKQSFENSIFVFLRTGKTASDENGELTDVGREQAEKFFERRGDDYGIVISSAEAGGIETARIIAGNEKEIIPISTLCSLPEKENTILKEMKEKYGDSPFSAYIQDENCSIVHKIGCIGAAEIKHLDGKLSGQKILIVSDSLALKSLIFWLFVGEETVKDFVCETHINECEAIRIVTGTDGGVLRVDLLN